MIVNFPETMDLTTGLNYAMYMSHGIFPNYINTYPSWVVGDNDGNNPLFSTFLIQMDYDTFVAAATKLSMISSGVALIMIICN